MRRIGILTAFVCAAAMMLPASAAPAAPGVTRNGEAVAFESTPQLISNRTMVPVKDGGTLLDAVVGVKDNTVTLDGSYVTIQFTLNDATVKVTHKYDFSGIPQEVTLDTAPQTIGHATYLPLRFAAETLGFRVIWDEKSRTADITQAKRTVKDEGLSMDAEKISDISLYDLNEVLVKSLDRSEYAAIAEAFNAAEIDDSMYPMMIAGYKMVVTMQDDSVFSFISYGSETNVVASVTAGESHASLHLRCPVIAKMLLGK